MIIFLLSENPLYIIIFITITKFIFLNIKADTELQFTNYKKIKTRQDLLVKCSQNKGSERKTLSTFEW